MFISPFKKIPLFILL